MPLEWFSKTRHDGTYKPLTSKNNLVYDKIDKVFGIDTKSSFEEIKSIIPQLPDLTRDERSRGHSFQSRIDKLSISIYCFATRWDRDSDSMKLELTIRVSYWDKL